MMIEGYISDSAFAFCDAIFGLVITVTFLYFDLFAVAVYGLINCNWFAVHPRAHSDSHKLFRLEFDPVWLASHS